MVLILRICGWIAGGVRGRMLGGLRFGGEFLADCPPGSGPGRRTDGARECAVLAGDVSGTHLGRVLDDPGFLAARERFWTAVLTDERYREDRVAVAERNGELVGIAMSGPPLDAGAAQGVGKVAPMAAELRGRSVDHDVGAGTGCPVAG